MWRQLDPAVMASETNIEPNVRQAQSKELFLKEKALTIAKAFKFGRGRYSENS